MTSPPQAAPGARALPKALTGHAGYLAVSLGQRAQQLFEEAIADLDLRPAQYDYLATVAEHGPLSQRELAAALGVDAARVVATTDALQEREIVTRVVDARDRRRNLITLTRTGRSLVTRASRVAERVENELLAALAPDDQVLLRGLLQRTLGFD